MPNALDVEQFYPMFANYARQLGVDAASRALSGMSPNVLTACRERWDEDRAQIQSGGPAILAAGKDSWYPGPLASDTYWPATRRAFENEGWPADRIEDVNRASSKVVAHTPRPSTPRFNSHGLVVGYVQSGKTSNYIAVASKMADLEYNLVIVLAGIHNGLRKQTQERLQQMLQSENSGAWHLLTSSENDFRPPGGSGVEAFLSRRNRQRTLAVIKKNATVLKRFLSWLDTTAGRSSLEQTKVLIIDDEADQASVATSSINPKIRELLALMPRHTYIAYTATPFANVFIDPRADDLYPKDFILNLPRPENYFGPETVFGMDVVDEESHARSGGLDMVRNVPDESIYALRPRPKEDVDSFEPEMTEELKDAIHWFWLATAARYARGGEDKHSSMLIHTSIRTKVHESFKEPITAYIAKARRLLAQEDAVFLSELEAQWLSETDRVPAGMWGRKTERFDVLLKHLPAVLDACKPIIENGGSDERLDYSGNEPVVAIVIGGNTLSRGLTLEGLVVSLFVRGAGQYDTLLQMGRWFGYRVGYEDLPRIWTTTELEQAFRHLAFVEAEMRADIERYQERDCTPQELAVRIYTHPTLRITGKMGAAVPQDVSYAGSRLQTRYFLTHDGDWLEANLAATQELLGQCIGTSTPTRVSDSGHLLFRDVDVSAIRKFLLRYNVHPDSSELDRDLVRKYIDRQTRDEDAPTLTKWNVVVINGPSGNPESPLPGAATRMVTRSRVREGADGDTPLGGTVSRADIKTLMSRRDIGFDLSQQPSNLSSLGEGDLFELRRNDPATRSNGLLVIYTIDPDSSPTSSRQKVRVPLGAAAPVVGIGLVFPGLADKTRSVQMAVQVTALDDEEIPDASEYEDAE